MENDLWIDDRVGISGMNRAMVGDDGMEMSKRPDDPSVGLWSKSIVLRVIVWIVMLQVAVILSLYAATLLSGFPSVFEMINSLRAGLGI